MQIDWLHISDIHYHYSSYDSQRIREEFLKVISDVSKKQNIDLIFCTGDLADKDGSYNENLVDYLCDISNATGVIKNNFFIVPGNHDHNRSISYDTLQKIYEYKNDIKEDNLLSSDIALNIENISQFDKDILLNSFGTYKQICSDFYNDNNNYNVDNSVDIRLNDQVSVARINTALFDRGSNDDLHELQICVKQLHELLKDNKNKDETINIAIGHHPMEIMDPLVANRFKDCLYTNGYGIYLCGHTHKAAFNYYKDYDLIEIICSYGNSDDYSGGGFSIGRIDTNKEKYYAEFYKWKGSSNWVLDTDVEGCNKYGRFYFDSKRYQNSTKQKIVIPLKSFGLSIDNNDIIKIIGPQFEVFDYDYKEINIESINWKDEIKSIVNIANGIKKIQDKELHIFPLCPIPLLITFGYELQKNSKLFIYQYDRDNASWVYESNEACPIYNVCWDKKTDDSSVLILKISCSTEIFEKQIHELLSYDESDIISLSLESKAPGKPLYYNHYNKMLNDLFANINPIAAKYDEIHVFASVPAGMALELGRYFQKGIYNSIYLYNFRKKYVLTNMLN